jgi:hypothetical protein
VVGVVGVGVAWQRDQSGALSRDCKTNSKTIFVFYSNP